MFFPSKDITILEYILCFMDERPPEYDIVCKWTSQYDNKYF